MTEETKERMESIGRDTGANLLEQAIKTAKNN